VWEFKQIKDLYLKMVVPCNLHTKCEARPDFPLRECRNVY